MIRKAKKKERKSIGAGDGKEKRKKKLSSNSLQLDEGRDRAYSTGRWDKEKKRGGGRQGKSPHPFDHAKRERSVLWLNHEL